MILSIEASGFTHDAEIYAIGLKTPRVEKTWKRWEYKSEEDMLRDFAKYFVTIDDKIVIGFNVVKFELMLMMTKMKAAGMPEFGDFWKKVNFSNVVDLFVLLTFMNKAQIKGLDHYAREYGFKTILLPWREVAKLYGKGEHDRIAQNLLRKLRVINGIFLTLWERSKKGNFGGK